MTVELVLFDMVQLARSNPIPLIVADEQVPIQSNPNHSGSQTACPRDKFTLLRHLQTHPGRERKHTFFAGSFSCRTAPVSRT